jgi:CheY-like chemotaxis protein
VPSQALLPAQPAASATASARRRRSTRESEQADEADERDEQQDAEDGASRARPTLLAVVAEHEPDLAIVDVRMPPTFEDEGMQAGSL